MIRVFHSTCVVIGRWLWLGEIAHFGVFLAIFLTTLAQAQKQENSKGKAGNLFSQFKMTLGEAEEQ